jgi:caffeoylshikimate esterase
MCFERLSIDMIIMVLLECGIRLARAGYAVFGIDYEGHGRSKGARCYIKKFENIVNDCYDFFKSVSGMHPIYHLSYQGCSNKHTLNFIQNDFSVQEGYRDKCRFLYGESMGGAVALLLHKKDPTFWNGAILVAPMCKVRKIILYSDCIHSLTMGLVGLACCE